MNERNKRGQVIASYGAQTPVEMVTACDARSDGLYDVTTLSNDVRCIYFAVAQRYEVGAELTAKVRCRVKQIRPLPWSPWDGFKDED